MKRLFTIFLSSIAAVCLWGQQSVPMAVYGDVYNVGDMESDGQVHLEALSKAYVAKMANYGRVTMKDSVFFYTNDSIDGLFMNQNKALSGLAINAKQVVVRKCFDPKLNTPSLMWYQIAFPFNVDLNNVRNAADGTQLTIANNKINFQFYNAQRRAVSGLNQESDWMNWSKLPTAATMDSIRIKPWDMNVLPKGQAYRVIVDVPNLKKAADGNVWVDFCAKTTADNDSLFFTTQLGTSLNFPTVTYADMRPNSIGWNVFGGMYSTEFVLNAATVGYPKTVYYRKSDAASATNLKFYPILPSAGEEGILRPYAVLNVQTDSTMFKNNTLAYKSTDLTGGFTYSGSSGLTLNDSTVNTDPVFRSLTAAPNDLLKLQFTDAKQNTYVARVYFKFNNTYGKFYNPAKDDLILTTSSNTDPFIWAIAAPQNSSVGNQNLFVNGIPNGGSEIPLGVNVPKAGDYIFSLKQVFSNNNAVKSAILLDKTTNKSYDLFKQNYTFTATGAVNTATRFVLFINQFVTSINVPSASEIYAYTDNNVLTVKNLAAGDKIQVMDVAGRIFASGIASGDTYTATLNQKGVYIVNVTGAKAKILKVLNK